MKSPRPSPALAVLMACILYWSAICLRGCGILDCSWWLLLAPLWFPTAALSICCAASWAGGLFFTLVGHMQFWWLRRRRPSR